MSDEIEKGRQRYLDAAHAMQTGVKWQMINQGDTQACTTPKHLRVGVNSALVNAEGLATLLIEKGLFTEAEYVKAIADAMEREVVRYQALLPHGVTLK